MNERMERELESTLALMEQKLPHPRRKKAPRRALALTLAVVLALGLTVGAGAAGIPGFGELFHLIHRNTRSDDYNGDNIALVEERMRPVMNEVTDTQEGDLKFSVKEAYYDGMTLYCVGEIETNQDPSAERTAWNYDIFINGVKLDFDYTLNIRDWVRIKEGRYINDSLSTKVPAEFRPDGAEEIRVRYVASHYSYGSEGDNGADSGLLEAASAEFTVACTEEAVNISETVEQNGVKFLYFHSSPATTEVAMDVPRELAGYLPGRSADIGLTVEGGKRVLMNNGSSQSSDEPEKYWRLVYSGEAVPTSETRLIARLITNDETQKKDIVTAEFLIDLEKRTVTPME